MILAGAPGLPLSAAELTAAEAATYSAAERILDPQALQVILDWLKAQRE
jgi:hypothetical protein